MLTNFTTVSTYIGHEQSRMKRLVEDEKVLENEQQTF
jgi:hypothetical protein